MRTSRISVSGDGGAVPNRGDGAIFEISPTLDHVEPDARRHAASPPRTPVIVRQPPVADEIWQHSAYQTSGRTRGPAAAGALVVVGGLIASLLYLNVAVPAAHETHRLEVLALRLTPPPPPKPAPQPHQTAAPAAPRIVAPPPVVALPAPPSPVATVLHAAPPAPIVGPPAPAVPGPPAPAPAAAPAVSDGGDLSSKMIVAKPPTYPIDSRRRHEEGTVVLSVLVATDGSVSEISVAQSSGSSLLDQAALGAVRKWRWAPLLRGGDPVMVRGEVKIPFVLKH